VKHPIPAPPPAPLAGRALSHAAPPVLVLLGLLAPACSGGAEAPPAPEAPAEPAPASGAERADLAALLEAFAPLDPTATSDVQDASLARQRALLAHLRATAGPPLGRLALESFDAAPAPPEAVRVALLDVAAHGLGAELAPRLEALITTYDAALGLRIRTEAVRILAETSPARALEFLAPLLREDRPSSTRPPQAALMEGWIRAARAVGGADTRVLADVATNLFQPPEAR